MKPLLFYEIKSERFRGNDTLQQLIKRYIVCLMADRHETFLSSFDIPLDQDNGDYAVAGCIADLAGFSDGTVVAHRSPGRLPNANRTVFVFSSETLDEYGPEPEVLVTRSPDILVDQTLNPDGFAIDYGLRVPQEAVEHDMVQTKIYEVAEKLKAQSQSS